MSASDITVYDTTDPEELATRLESRAPVQASRGNYEFASDLNAAAIMLRDFDELRAEDQGRPTVVCLCGSTRFREAYVKSYREESLAGRIVLSVGVMVHAGDEPIRDENDPRKALLDELHLRKIDLADEVLILNVDGYIGASTGNELEYARKLGKRIRFWEDSNKEVT